jgi:hypothetical protein
LKKSAAEHLSRRSRVIAQSALCVLVIAGVTTAKAAETCHYSGTSSYSGRLTVETKAETTNGETTVDASATVVARSFGIINWRYQYQEIGTWRGDELQSVGVNHRYSVAGSIRRQQWDVFDRTPTGMSARRVQGKTLADFQLKHPGFVGHWDPASFGQPWRSDYASAPPERRTDLDLPRSAMASDLGTPLILAFYWVRFAGPADRTVPVFLPGFKRNARADIRVVSMGVESNGLLHLRAIVRHPQLSETQISTGDAWISPDHHLAHVTFDAHADHGSAQGDFRLDGCQGER